MPDSPKEPPMTRTVRSAAIAVLTALAAVAAIIAADFTAPAQAQSDEITGRIVARLLDDGRIEFGWQPTGGARTLPTKRYFPASIDHNRWLRSSPVEVGGAEIGRLNARLSEDGRIEFAFTPTDGERITPQVRYFPPDARVGRWLRSTEITIPAGDGERTTSSDDEHATSTDGEHATSSDDEHAASADGEQATGSDDERAASNDGEHATSTDDERATSADDERATSSDDEYATSSDDEHATSSDDEHATSSDDEHATSTGGAFTAVSAGGEHTCGLRESGAIECWGGYHRQSDTPEGSYSAVSAGGSHTCGLRESGAIECWGNNGDGQSDAPPGAFTAVSAGEYHTCAIRKSDNAIECWGANGSGQSDAREGSYSAVSAGGEHSCALRSTGEIECWGDTWLVRSHNPPGNYSAVSAGGQHTCFLLRESGAIECWGANWTGQTNAPRGPGQFPTIRVFAVDDGVTEAQLSEVRQQMAAIVRWFAARWSPVATPPGRVLVHSTDEFPAHIRNACGAAGDKTIYYRLTCPGQGTLAHEYAHLAQARPGQEHPGSGGYHGPKWMAEGMATWVGSVYESQNGGRSYQALQSNRWRAARQARNQYALDDPSLPYDAHYTMGFVAAERLAQLAGEQAIFDFWPNLRRAPQNAQGAAEVFEATFGITLAEFYATFDAYLNGVRPSIQIAPND